MTGRRAFSLAEVVITLFLVALVFGVVAVLISKAYRVLSFQTMKQRSALAAQVALDRISAELREATAVTGTGGRLDFRKIDKSVPGRFDLASPPSNYPFGTEIAVSYRSDGRGNLVRVVGGQTQVVVEGVTGFACSTVGPRLDLALSIQEQQRVRRVSTAVFLPGVAP
ncbi:MAG: hypothetical protein AB1758_26475 [Candidatus Eremiobacterota bacterium]